MGIMTIRVAPSILACDFARLGAEVARATASGADYIHIDVMDGHFVPNITLGPMIVGHIRPYTSLPLDVHLMVDHPEVYAPAFIEAGASIVTFHVEAPGVSTRRRLQLALDNIRRLGARAGLVLKPRTPAEAVFPYLDRCAMVLVMTVEPGFGGQEFMNDMLPKLDALRREAGRRRLELDIEVDGGIDNVTASLCAAHGANVFVAGTYLFSGRGMARRIAAFHHLRTPRPT